MSISLGPLAYTAAVGLNGDYSFSPTASRNHSIASTSSSSGKSLDSLKTKASKRNSPSYSARAWVHRSRDNILPAFSTDPASDSAHKRAGSQSRQSERSGKVSPHDSFDLPQRQPHSQIVTKRPKHIPIIIPDIYSYVTPALGSASSAGSYFSVLDPPRPSISSGTTLGSGSSSSTRRTPRHVEINIPDWANPYMREPIKSPATPAKTQGSESVSPKETSTSPKMAQQTPESSRANTMESTTSRPSPERLYGDRSDANSQNDLTSHFGSQTSLVSLTMDDVSASESEDNGTKHSGKPASTTEGQEPSQTQTASTNTASLSGLVCNVHRTTGKEPHPLVGATTTILGDKLYVFGGRRLSRTKPTLTSNLYELDLIKRHWTKIDARGDVPAPRYFHSVCALGDTKLVCYGGMSPGVVPEGSADAPPPEVTVMSDIHIFDVPTSTWTKLSTPDAPQGRYAHCAAILPSSAVFASKNAPLSAIHHNPAGANPNQGTLGVALDGSGGAEMVVVGGQDNANHYIEQVSVFNLRSLKWTGTTGMGRSCGAYRSVVTPLTTMTASQIGAGPHQNHDQDDEDDEPTTLGSGAPMLIYSNYNFLDVKLELQIRLVDGTLTEKTMNAEPSPPGLRFPNGGIIGNNFVVSGTFLTSSKQEYAVWSLDLRTLTWSRIDAGSSIFSQGSWNRGVVWNRRNAFVILGNRKRTLVDDYNNRRINFSNICVVELEAFGLYQNPKIAEPTSGFVSGSGLPARFAPECDFGRLLSSAAEDLGSMAMSLRELADMDFLAIDGTRIPVNSRLISRRWGPHFITLLRESLMSAADADTATLRPSLASHPSRNSSITITPSTTSTSTTLTNNSTELPDTKTAPATTRPRLFYLPHTTPTLHALLHYLYTSTLPSPPHPLATPQIFCSLLQLARPYRIDGLLETVIERLHEYLDGRNAAAVFNAAAMGAGGGDSVQFATATRSINESDIPVRTASLAGIEGLLTNGGARTIPGLRIDTDVANARSARNTLRPGERPGERKPDATNDDEVPGSATTDSSMSEGELSMSARSLTDEKYREVWSGGMSAVVGLQKRGLRGLMEGRRMRERERGEVHSPSRGPEGGRVGLGIA